MSSTKSFSLQSQDPQICYCINRRCKQRQQAINSDTCQSCQSPLLVNGCYRPISPLIALGKPGNAELFEVQDIRFPSHPPKILKVLKYSGADLVRLFRQEAEILATFQHPAIPKVKADDGYFTIRLPTSKKPVHCLVMEKVPGQNLRDWLSQHGAIAEAQALNWLKQLLKLLKRLHQAGYLHRDIKPSNLMLKPDGAIALIDFGAIKQIPPVPDDDDLEDQNIPREMTITGTGIFSTGYSPAEQINGKAIPQSDLFALGRTFVFLLTAKHPMDLCETDQGQLQWRSLAPHISQEFGDWIDYLMAPLVSSRPSSAGYVLKHLQQKRLRSPQHLIPTTPNWLFILNAVLFTVLSLTSLLWWQAYRDSQRAIPSIPTQSQE